MIIYSIIIPIYNAEDTIIRCIDSILKQNFKNYELLLVDDGSTDNSSKICDEYEKIDSRISVYHKPNGGVSSARNLGIIKAKGEWITFIDADDYIEQDFLSTIPQNEYSLIINNWRPSTSNDFIEYIPPIELLNKKQVIQFINKHLQLDLMRCPWAKFFKRTTIINNKIIFDERFKIGEDTLFVMSYLYHCKSIKINNNGVYRYYQRPCEETNIKYQLEINKSIDYLDSLYYIYKKLKCNNKQFLKLLYNFYKEKTKNINEPTTANRWIHHPVILKMLWITYYKDDYKNYIYFLKLCLLSLLQYKKQQYG